MPLLHLFWNAFAANIVLTFSSEQTFYAMAAFGGYALTFPFLVSVAGATLGQFVHFVFGSYLDLLRRKYGWWLEDAQHEKLRHYVNRYGAWLLLCFFFPLYPILPIIAGFFRVSPARAMTFVALAKVAEQLVRLEMLMKLMG